jgi:hypothetical protein
MEILPLEILDIIAVDGGYRGLLGIRRFTDSLTISRRTDFMIGLGYSVEITRRRIIWRYNDDCHRADGPAIEKCDGTKKWYLDGEYHRIDGPALEYSGGIKEWYLNGNLH